MADTPICVWWFVASTSPWTSEKSPWWSVSCLQESFGEECPLFCKSLVAGFGSVDLNPSFSTNRMVETCWNPRNHGMFNVYHLSTGDSDFAGPSTVAYSSFSSFSPHFYCSQCCCSHIASSQALWGQTRRLCQRKCQNIHQIECQNRSRAFTYITMLKIHCVTNLHASTQRCARCVLELLRSEYMSGRMPEKKHVRQNWREYMPFFQKIRSRSIRPVR